MKNFFFLLMFLFITTKAHSACEVGSCYLYTIAPYGTQGTATSNVTSNVFVPNLTCSGNHSSGYVTQTTEIIANGFRIVNAHLYIYKSVNSLWVQQSDVTVQYWIPVGASMTTYMPPSFTSFIFDSNKSSVIPDGQHCVTPPVSSCSGATSCFRYYLKDFASTTGQSLGNYTSYIPKGNCGGDSLNGTATIETVATTATTFQTCKMVVDQLVNGVWKPIYNSTTLLVLPLDGTHPLGWLLPGWMSQSAALALPVDGSGCSFICPNPTSEAEKKALCPFSKGTYTCSSNSIVCDYKTCDEVRTAVLADKNLICPDEPDPFYQCNMVDGYAKITDVICKNCAFERYTFGVQQCIAPNGEVQTYDADLLATFNCETGLGLCKDCNYLAALWYQDHCGRVDLGNGYNCLSDVGQCLTCDEEKVKYALEHCGSETNLGTYDCNNHTGSCKLTDPVAICSNFEYGCLIKCKSKTNIAAQSCENGVILVPCTCISQSSLAISNGVLVPDSLGNMRPSPVTISTSFASSSGDTPEQSYVKMVDNTNATNKTIGSGFESTHDDAMVTNSYLDRILSALAGSDSGTGTGTGTGIGSGSGLDGEGNIEEQGEVDLNPIFQGYSDLKDLLPNANLDGITITDISPYVTIELFGISKYLDLTPFLPFFSQAGDYLYVLSCLGSLLIILL